MTTATPSPTRPRQKRKPMTKKVRFEVFKRDGFKCQYCGAMAPDVVLHVDHIHPVSKGGEDSLLNYVTACAPCNSGKGARTLDDSTAVKKQQTQLQELHDRREQIEMMRQWRDSMRDLLAVQVEVFVEAWKEEAPGTKLSDKAINDARLWVKRYGLQTVLDALDRAAEKYLQYEAGSTTPTLASAIEAWSKLPGICAYSALPQNEQKLRYIRGILKNRCNSVPFDVLDDLRDAVLRGWSAAALEEEAKSCRSWTQFKYVLANDGGGQDGAL